MKLLREGLLERASQPGLQEVAWPLHVVLTHILWRLVSNGLVKRGVAWNLQGRASCSVTVLVHVFCFLFGDRHKLPEAHGRSSSGLFLRHAVGTPVGCSGWGLCPSLCAGDTSPLVRAAAAGSRTALTRSG